MELEREADFIVSVGWDTDWKPPSVEYFVVSKDALSTRLLGSDDDWRPPMDASCESGARLQPLTASYAF